MKLLLLDQRIVAGLGNIYACEALFRARIDPRKPAGKVSRPKLDALAEAIPAVLEEAIRGRRLDACAISPRPTASSAISPSSSTSMTARASRAAAATAMVRRIVQGGRSTFFCPACQR